MSRKDQPATKYAITMITNENPALTHGFIVELRVNNPNNAVRPPFNAASIAPQGLRRIRPLIACDAIHTTAKIAMPKGTVRMLSNHDRSNAANWIVANVPGKPTETGPAAAIASLPMIIFDSAAMVKGTTAPAATNPVA